MKKYYEPKQRPVEGELKRKIIGVSKYVEARLTADSQGEILIRWKGSSIKFEDKSFGDADIFVRSDNVE